MLKRMRDEKGIAMVVVMLVMMVLLSLSIAVVQLSTHSGVASGLDLRKNESVQAAETGLAAYLAVLPTGVGTIAGEYKICAMQGETVQLSTTPVAEYTLDITLHTAVDGGGTHYQCPPKAPPAGYQAYAGQTTLKSALITATATAGTVTSNSAASTRTLQEMVNLTAIPTDALTNAIYGSKRVVISSNVNIYYNETTNDADIYSRGDVIVNNYLDLQGSIYAAGLDGMSGKVVAKGCLEGNVYAKGNVTITAAYIGACNSAAQPGADPQSGVNIYPGWGNITASGATSTLTLPPNAWAYGTCRAGTGGNPLTGGPCSSYRNPAKPNTPVRCGEAVPPGADPQEPCGYVGAQPDPPNLQFPIVNYAALNWTNKGYTVRNYGTCAAAKTALQDYLGTNPDGWTGDNVISLFGVAACGMTLDAGNYTLRGNLGLIINGSFETNGGVAIANSGSETHTFYVERPTNGLGPDLSTQAGRDANCGADPGETQPRSNNPANLTPSYPYDQRFSTKTDMSTIKFLSYTPCNLRTYNQNKSGSGQFIAGESMYIRNSFSLAFAPIELPDVEPVGWRAAPVFIREIAS